MTLFKWWNDLGSIAHSTYFKVIWRCIAWHTHTQCNDGRAINRNYFFIPYRQIIINAGRFYLCMHVCYLPELSVLKWQFQLIFNRRFRNDVSYLCFHSPNGAIAENCQCYFVSFFKCGWHISCILETANNKNNEKKDIHSRMPSFNITRNLNPFDIIFCIAVY